MIHHISHDRSVTCYITGLRMISRFEINSCNEQVFTGSLFCWLNMHWLQTSNFLFIQYVPILTSIDEIFFKLTPQKAKAW